MEVAIARARRDAFGDGTAQLQFPVQTLPRVFQTGWVTGNVGRTQRRHLGWLCGARPQSAAFDDPCRALGQVRKPFGSVDLRQGLAATVGRRPVTGDFAGDFTPFVQGQRGQRPFEGRAVTLGSGSEIARVARRDELAASKNSQDELPGKDLRHGFERQTEQRFPLISGPWFQQGFGRRNAELAFREDSIQPSSGKPDV